MKYGGNYNLTTKTTAIFDPVWNVECLMFWTSLILLVFSWILYGEKWWLIQLTLVFLFFLFDWNPVTVIEFRGKLHGNISELLGQVDSVAPVDPVESVKRVPRVPQVPQVPLMVLRTWNGEKISLTFPGFPWPNITIFPDLLRGISISERLESVIFDFLWLSKTLRNGIISLFVIFIPWLKKNVKLIILKRSRMA